MEEHKKLNRDFWSGREFKPNNFKCAGYSEIDQVYIYFGHVHDITQ